LYWIELATALQHRLHFLFLENNSRLIYFIWFLCRKNFVQYGRTTSKHCHQAQHYHCCIHHGRSRPTCAECFGSKVLEGGYLAYVRSRSTCQFMTILKQLWKLYSNRYSYFFRQLDTEGSGNSIDQHKQDLLKKQKDGKGHWKDELASNSESIVCHIFSLSVSTPILHMVSFPSDYNFPPRVLRFDFHLLCRLSLSSEMTMGDHTVCTSYCLKRGLGELDIQKHRPWVILNKSNTWLIFVSFSLSVDRSKLNGVRLMLAPRRSRSSRRSRQRHKRAESQPSSWPSFCAIGWTRMINRLELLGGKVSLPHRYLHKDRLA